jgi:asparagine synthase (glutamine-hydrolysing)
MFALALWDSNRRSLLLARDRLGKKPLYYSNRRGAGFFFASELKALRILLSAANEPPRIRPLAVYDYLSLGAVLQPDTVYEDVSMVRPGHCLILANCNVEEIQYWTPSFQPKLTLSYGEAQEEVRRLIEESVDLRLRSDVPLGVFLSGGLDSSIVAYEAARKSGTPLKTFTVSVPDRDFNEAPLAQRTARNLGVEWTELPLEIAPEGDLLFIARHFDQPFADSSAIPSLAISRLAGSHVTVVLNGDGGDELFGGYRRYLAARALGRLGGRSPVRRVAASIMRRIPSDRRRSPFGFLRRFGRGLTCSNGERYLVWTNDLLLDRHKEREWLGDRQRSPEDWVATRLPVGLSELDTQVAGDIAISLLSDLLVKMDMATMAASLEARSPLLDHHVVEYALRLPDNFRVRGLRLKALLRDAYRGRLPEEVVGGRKRGFEVPLARWLQHDLHELLNDTLGCDRPALADFVDRSFVRTVVSGDVNQDWNRPALVYALLVLELWLRAERERGRVR